MSAIALKWVAQTKVGNAIAKHLLLFYASHNFNRPGFEFSIKTLTEQLEISESSVVRAMAYLVKHKFIVKKKRFDKKTGRQTTSLIFLNIPKDFSDEYFVQKPVSKGFKGSHTDRGEGVTQTGGGCLLDTPINNKYNNKKREREISKAVDNFHTTKITKQSAAFGNEKLDSLPLVPLSLNYSFKTSTHEFGHEQGLTASEMKDEIAKFEMHHIAKGTLNSDNGWNLLLKKWFINAKEYKAKKYKGATQVRLKESSSEPHSTVPFYVSTEDKTQYASSSISRDFLKTCKALVGKHE